MSTSSTRDKQAMATHRVPLDQNPRLSYYRHRASRVSPKAVGDQGEARKEALEVFDELAHARKRANRAIPDKE